EGMQYSQPLRTPPFRVDSDPAGDSTRISVSAGRSANLRGYLAGCSSGTHIWSGHVLRALCAGAERETRHPDLRRNSLPRQAVPSSTERTAQEARHERKEQDHT